MSATLPVHVSAADAAAPCEPVLARLVSLQGAVEVQPAAATGWLPARLDDRLCLGDTVRVGAYGRAALALANDSVLRIDQRTTLRLGGEVARGRSLLELLFGDVHFFSHRPRALEILTPIASAGTEGTEFLLRARPERTEVVMLAGRVRLQTAAGELVVASGDAAVARAGAAPLRETVARPRDAVAWALYYPPVLAPLAGGEVASALPAGLQAALARVAANDFAGALAALDEVPAAARDARFYTYRAGVLLGVGRVDEAEAALAAALAEEPAAAGALAQRAVLRVVQDRRAEGLADARQAVALSPDSTPARIALSYALQADFALEEARAALREAVARSPADPLAWARLAELEQSFGELAAAQAAAERAVALAPDLARTQMVLGFAALTRIDIAGAIAAFERAIALDSAEPFARLGLGLARIRRGDLEAGRRELEIAAALDPNSSLLRSYLGKAYFEERRGPLDAEQFAIAKQLDPNDPTPWFYDAIRLQTENRPVEALRSLERSIALNDNRAPFRSRLLLDEDRATRGVSLARIYDDLGFQELGIDEASKSLAVDPANAGAHHFLSDVLIGVPRREIARVSNLLQAKMLQDNNMNPVQPSLGEANLNILTQGGPARAGFNEFTPLFERERAEMTAAGLVGEDDTYGGEGVISMLYDRYSLSVGAFHYETDGFRVNNEIEHDIQNAFFQAAITPELNVQAEVRRRRSDEGDLALDFDPASFSRDLRRHLEEETGRLGLRYSPTATSDLLLSYIYGTLDDHNEDVLEGDPARRTSDDEGHQLEVQYLYTQEHFNVTGGARASNVDRAFYDDFTLPPIRNHQKITDHTGYLYNNVSLPEPVTWTLGASYSNFEHGALKVEKWNPKLGVRWQVTEDLSVRGALFRVSKPALINNQLLEPTQIAGFNQFFDDANGDASWRYGIGIDGRVSEGFFVGAEATWREVSNTILNRRTDAKRLEQSDEQTHEIYLTWLPSPDFAVSAKFVYDRFTAEDDKILTVMLGVPEKLVTYSVPVEVRYFHQSGFFAGVGATYVNQDVRRAAGYPDGSSDFVLVDAAIGYRLPKRFGIVSLTVSNLFDEGFEYMDDSFREFEAQPAIGPYIPDRQIVARLTLNW